MRIVQVTGFSGTNDNEPLLPLTVKVMPSKDKHIQGTDGRMLCLLARPGKCRVTALSKSGTEASTQQQALWTTLLNLALKEQAHALIDAGVVPDKASAAVPYASLTPQH